MININNSSMSNYIYIYFNVIVTPKVDIAKVYINTGTGRTLTGR